MKNVNKNVFHEVLFFLIISYKIVPSGVKKLLWLKAGREVTVFKEAVVPI